MNTYILFFFILCWIYDLLFLFFYVYICTNTWTTFCCSSTYSVQCQLSLINWLAVNYYIILIDYLVLNIFFQRFSDSSFLNMNFFLDKTRHVKTLFRAFGKNWSTFFTYYHLWTKQPITQENYRHINQKWRWAQPSS